jgi:ribosomal-protein-alanine N-acetyltransferase
MVSQTRAQNEFYVEPMTEHDLLEVVEIEESSGLSRWGWDAYHAELTQGEHALMLVARPLGQSDVSNTEKVKGFIAARLIGGEVHINNVAVRHRYRRGGIALALLRAVLLKAAQTGAETAFLEVRAGNAPAQALYQRCGFRVTGRRSNYYSGPLEDALVMSLAIRSSA